MVRKLGRVVVVGLALILGTSLISDKVSAAAPETGAAQAKPVVTGNAAPTVVKAKKASKRHARHKKSAEKQETGTATK